MNQRDEQVDNGMDKTAAVVEVAVAVESMVEHDFLLLLQVVQHVVLVMRSLAECLQMFRFCRVEEDVYVLECQSMLHSPSMTTHLAHLDESNPADRTPVPATHLSVSFDLLLDLHALAIDDPDLDLELALERECWTWCYVSARP